MRRTMLVTAALVLALVGAGAAVVGIQQATMHLGRSAVDALAIQRDANALARLEWQAVAEETVSPSMDAEQRRLRRELSNRTARAARGGGPLTRRLDRVTEVYDRAVEEEFAALRKGDLETAAEIDEARVDPTFERVQRLSQQLATQSLDSADQRGALLKWLAAAVVLVAVGITVLVLRRESKRAAAEADLAAQQRSAARFEAMVAGATDVVMVTDADGRLSYVSPAVEKVAGADPASWLDLAVPDLVHPDDRGVVKAALHRTVARPDGSAKVEYRLQHSDGGERVCESYLRNLSDQQDVAGVVWNTRDVTDRRALEHRLSHQAFHDALTGLPNRGLLHDRIEHAANMALRDGSRPAVLVLDLDGFKDVNDSLGHAAGDDLLRCVAERLTCMSRAGDTVARLGGDEFAVLVEQQTGAEDITALAGRILSAIAEPLLLHGRQLHLTTSIGVAWSEVPGEGEFSAVSLIRNADLAMYAAKQRGKNQLAVYEAAMQVLASERLELISDLHDAVLRGEIRVAYQPIVTLDGADILGFEALVRWQHPLRGLLAPGDFLPLAEESGVILDISGLVISTAAHQVAQWRARTGRPFTISVNLSDRQLADPGLLGHIRVALDNSGLPAEALVLEITETAVISDASAASSRLTLLRDMGVRVAIDDFGTGYSSLSYLRNLPVDILKIDRSFVSDRTSTHADQLLAGVVALAEALAMETVAEGIEDEAQLERLRGLGCGQGQGFYFARPMWADDIERALVEGLPVTVSVS